MSNPALKTFIFFLFGFLTITVVHELTHGFIAKQFCQQVSYNWIPTTDYFMRTVYSKCTELGRLRDLQLIVEIVGYQLIALYTALTGFAVLYSQKVNF